MLYLVEFISRVEVEVARKEAKVEGMMMMMIMQLLTPRRLLAALMSHCSLLRHLPSSSIAICKPPS
jgi:hypothetical protein